MTPRVFALLSVRLSVVDHDTIDDIDGSDIQVPTTVNNSFMWHTILQSHPSNSVTIQLAHQYTSKYPTMPQRRNESRDSHQSILQSPTLTVQPVVPIPLRHSRPLTPCLSNPRTKPSHFLLSSAASFSARHLTHSSTLMPFSSSVRPPAA